MCPAKDTAAAAADTPARTNVILPYITLPKSCPANHNPVRAIASEIVSTNTDAIDESPRVAEVAELQKVRFDVSSLLLRKPVLSCSLKSIVPFSFLQNVRGNFTNPLRCSRRKIRTMWRGGLSSDRSAPLQAQAARIGSPLHAPKTAWQSRKDRHPPPRMLSPPCSQPRRLWACRGNPYR